MTVRSQGAVTAAWGNAYLYAAKGEHGEWESLGGNTWLRADGTYTIDNVAPGDYKVVLEVEGTPSTFVGGAMDVDSVGADIIHVAPGQKVVGIDLELQAYASMEADVAATDGNGSSLLAAGYTFLWRLDEFTGSYEMALNGSQSITEGHVDVPQLPAGTYAAQFQADPRSGIGAEYYLDARLFGDRTDFVIEPGMHFDLGQVTLGPRYFDVDRHAGPDRFATAVEISRQIVPMGERATVVYVTNAYNFPDALAAGPAAIRQGGVILSTDPSALPAIVADRLVELDPHRVVILGDANSVSSNVEATVRRLVSDDAEVLRLGGADRYATADLIVRDAFGSAGATHALIATARNYPDALAAGPAAGAYDAPVILVDGQAGLDDRTRTILHDLGVTRVFIVGGVPSVGSRLQNDLNGEFGADAVSRYAGADRYETASIVSGLLIGQSDHAFVTTGANYADALTGGPLAGALGAPLYLAYSGCVPPAVMDGIVIKQVASINLFGSEASLGRPVEELVTC